MLAVKGRLRATTLFKNFYNIGFYLLASIRLWYNENLKIIVEQL